MKVLSLTEPFATLIKEKKKFVETRSWKTEYRGELYIHASSTKIPGKWRADTELMALVDDKNFNYGQIICKCNLVDCVYMREEYVEKMRKDNYQEYICGIYEVGRYAWILDDIEELEMPIKARGQLGLWNYYNELEIMALMDDIKYGWVDKNNKLLALDEENLDDYVLQSPTRLLKNKIGVCWDQVELERYYFKNNDWNVKTFFIIYRNNDNFPTHTFLTFEKKGKYYWFEHSWEMYRGIYEYNTLSELLMDVLKKFINDELHNKYNEANLVLYEYNKPKFGISGEEFYKHCESGKVIEREEIYL